MVLRDLRNRVLDEDASISGLLRMCVMLSSLTGSESLRSWAQAELRGYNDDVDLPEYRKLALPLYIDSQSGPTLVRGQQISVFAVPRETRSAFDGPVQFRQAIQELAELANSDDGSIAISRPGFAEVAALWTSQLGMFQQVDRIYHQVSRSAIAGMVDVVRTTLVELVADIAVGVPVHELPTRARVNAAVNVNVYGGSQDDNSITVGSNSGVVGQGTGSLQSQTNGVASEHLATLIADLRVASESIADEDDRADVNQAIDDLETSVSVDQPDVAVVDRRVRSLRRLADSIGGALVAALSSEGARLALAAAGVGI